MDTPESKEESSTNKLRSNVSPHILKIPQNKPLFYPIGFRGFLGWVAPPVFYPV